MTDKMPTYFISHGGGPWPWMDDMRKMLAPLETSLARMPDEVGQRPRAVLMISGHWEEDAFTVMTSAQPPMLYDYYNFPPETYEIQYPAPGDPQLADEIAGLIETAGLPVARDAERGFDHGTFVPMAVMYPEADMPLVQVSMNRNYDPEQHFALGRALAPLRDQGVLIVGSGLSYHNLSMLGPESRVPSEEFDAWLRDALAASPDVRTTALLDWERAPSARICHAKEDHLVPLFAAVGAAEDAKAERVYHQTSVFGGLTASSYKFG